MLKVAWVAKLASTKVAKAIEKALRAAEKYQAQELQHTQLAERTEGRQTSSGIGVISTPKGCSKFAFSTAQFTPCLQVHASLFPHLHSSKQVPSHLFYTAPPPFLQQCLMPSLCDLCCPQCNSYHYSRFSQC